MISDSNVRDMAGVDGPHVDPGKCDHPECAHRTVVLDGRFGQRTVCERCGGVFIWIGGHRLIQANSSSGTGVDYLCLRCGELYISKQLFRVNSSCEADDGE